ncbi:aspartate/glutamate racemase family protein [Pseudonocardia sp. KRD-184]|uniref:Maleate isomerase n=2 Tax=Pseudonocardia oceani TaxID=2792013 RepID=A0ABS6U850_9PSEU|nr:aspartate/glutamate racemase family protein [Pseudonocardia oceani]MBW0095555.1 aspartate/glutamate racemase family protein [Pseudonocardia oceani]MBW0108207.1 aspartate/glutamate racemase family protein [Pseudonocardia oceani]MBW0120656.1 aspartate/glutamate racemase family protein [Pseudonocardia oceani]MBW0128410.1 aspartate/glutamate racemase family protein [Pseudonocardia oceani]
MTGQAGTDHHIGMIVPSSNLTMETELPRMLRAREGADPGDRFVFHAARARMQHVTPEQLRAMNAQADRAAAELADARPDVVATACLVAIMAQGPGFHCTAEDSITAVLRAEGSHAPVVSSAGALLSGIAALGAKRVALITPYMQPLTQAVVDYLQDAGVQVVDSLSLEVPDNLAVARLDPADLREHWRKLDLTGADALVLSACVQMPSLAAVEAVQRDCGLPVLSAATATTFRILSELGLATNVPGAGELLSGRYTDPARAAA